jgi:hypothetical protein
MSKETKRDLIETIRVLAWFHSVAMEAECKPTAYAVTERFEQLLIDAGVSIEDWPDIQFQRYVNGGTTPSLETLNRIEQILPTTKDTYDIGPKSESSIAPLWFAMGGSIEAVRHVIDWYDDVLRRAQLAGMPFEQLMFSVTDPIFPRHLFQEYLPTWQHDVNRNPFAYAIQEGMVTITMDRFTVLVALFRFSIYTGIGFPMMDFMLTGLLHKAVYDLFDEWGIARQVKTYLEIIRDQQREVMLRGLEAFKAKHGGKDIRYQKEDED